MAAYAGLVLRGLAGRGSSTLRVPTPPGHPLGRAGVDDGGVGASGSIPLRGGGGEVRGGFLVAVPVDGA